MTAISRKRLALTSSLAVLGLLAAGCANQTTAYRTQRIGPGGPMVITTDAYQRHLVIAGDPEQAGTWRACAEASPDVFAAISGSGAADLGFNSTGTNGVEAEARAAMSIAQSAATAERTQTINLLRESMFRTCERYMNGAIDRATLVVQAGRDWRAMIAILAIEQLTATGRPPSTIVSAGGTSATVMGGDDARRALDEAKENQSAAKQRLEDAEARTCEAADASGAGGSAGAGAGSGASGNSAGGAGAGAGSGAGGNSGASGNSGGGAGGASGGSSGASGSDSGSGEGAEAETETDSNAADGESSGSASDGGSTGGGSGEAPAADEDEGPDCATEKETEISSARAAVGEADEEVAAAQRRVDQIARSGAATTPGTVSAVGHARSLTPAALRIVAPIVERIVMEAFDTDETQLFCLQIMSRPDEPQGVDLAANEGGTTVRQMCVQYLAARVQTDLQALAGWQVSDVARARLQGEINEIEAYLAQGGGSEGTPGERWNRLVAPIQARFPFTPLAVPANAAPEQIRGKMRIIGSALRELVIATR